MPEAIRVKIAIIGTGHIGPRHASSVVRSNEAELVCFVDPAPQAETTVKPFQCPLFRSIGEMFYQGIRPDAALVCTPNSTHVKLAQELLSAGVHVLVEKPISTTVSSGADLVRVARQTGRKLLVGHHRRFNPHIVAAKRTLLSGTIGTPIAISGLWAGFKPSSYFKPPAQWRASAGHGK